MEDVQSSRGDEGLKEAGFGRGWRGVRVFVRVPPARERRAIEFVLYAPNLYPTYASTISAKSAKTSAPSILTSRIMV